MTRFRIGYNGVLIGIILALLAWHNSWLQMRVAVAWLIPIGLIGVILCYFYYGKKLHQNWAIFRFPTTLGIFVVMGIIFLLMYGFNGLLVVLGALIREPFSAMWPLTGISLTVLGLLVLGLVIEGIQHYFKPVPKFPKNENIQELTAQSKIGIILTVLILVACVGSYLWITPFHHFVNEATGMLAKLDIHALRDYLQSFGFWGPLISALIMVFQSVLAPLPAFLLTFTNAYLWGWFWGAVLSWSSAMVGAIVCFYIARGLGRPFAEKVITKKALHKIDHFFDEYGNYTVMVLRLLPFVSFDEVSYGAGFTSMKLVPFLIGTGIGQLPATIVYSLVGGSLNGNKLILFLAIIGFMILIVGSLVARKVLANKQRKAQMAHDELS